MDLTGQKLPYEIEIITAYSEEDRAERQKKQDEQLEEDLKTHVVENARARASHLDLVKTTTIHKNTKQLLGTLNSWMENARKASDKEYQELASLGMADAATQARKRQEIAQATEQRSKVYNALQQKMLAVKKTVEDKTEEVTLSEFERIKSSAVITDIELDIKNMKAHYTCKGCAKNIEIKYKEMPKIDYGTVVDGIPLDYSDIAKRVTVPLFQCPKCGKYHILPYQVIENLREYAKIGVAKYMKAHKVGTKSGETSENTIAYILIKEIYSPCLRVAVDTTVDNVSNRLTKLSEDKLNIAKELENAENQTDNTKETEDIFSQLLDLYNDGPVDNAEDISNKDIDNTTIQEEPIENLINEVMLEKLDKSKLAYSDSIVYETYDTENLDELSFEELTAYGKLYSFEIQAYLHGKNPNEYADDIYSLLVLNTADSTNVLPKAITEVLDKKYTDFQPVNVLNMYNF